MAQMNEDNRRELLQDVLELIASLIRTIHVRRALRHVCPEPQLNFWRVICGDLTDFAVLEWCKLFGSDDEQHQTIHWKNVVPDIETFRQELFAHLHLSPEEFNAYWLEMKRYRDWGVAHHDRRRKAIPRYPHFDVALESAYFYFDFVLSELNEQGIELGPRDIRDYAARFFEQARAIAAVAMDATKSTPERVF